MSAGLFGGQWLGLGTPGLRGGFGVDYDLGDLDALPKGRVAMFILAAHGEGGPMDRAVVYH